jgi:DNA-binding transcriptional LysR family regulator
MINIPTELLRTFVAVVDLRSFTKAAQSLGITQPAVSAQVKRLQQLLGGDLMDKSAIRVGMPGDFVGAALWRTLRRFRGSRPDIRFHVKSGPSESLARDMREGELDVALTVSGAAPRDDARFHWSEDMVWVRAPQTEIDPRAPVPLVSHGEKCLAHRQVADALERAGFAFDPPFTETSLTNLTSAVGAGLGVMALPRCVSQGADLAIWDDAPLPPLPKIVCNVCVRSGADDVVDQFARALADAFGVRAPPAPDHAAG